MKNILILICIIGSALAEDIYVSDTGTGNGTSSASPRSRAWFNTLSNWDTDVAADGLIGPGDTVHLVGTITDYLQFQRSGTVGNRITLKFDPGAKMSRPVWYSIGAIRATGLHDFTIEGGNAGSMIDAYDGTAEPTPPTQVDMEATANGTGIVGSVSGTRFLYLDQCGANITVKNLWMKHIYNRTYGHATDVFDGSVAVSFRHAGNGLFENNAVICAETGISMNGNNSPETLGMVIKDNLFVGCANGIKMGPNGVLNMVDPKIIGNRIDHSARWSGPATDAQPYHIDGIQTIGETAGSYFYNLHVAYNHIGPHNAAVVNGNMTAPIFLAHRQIGTKVYNNYIEYDEGASTNQAIAAGPRDPTVPNFTADYIVNNTFVVRGATPHSAPIRADYAVIQGNVCVGFANQVTNGDGNHPFTSNLNNFYTTIPYAFGVANGGTLMAGGTYSQALWQSVGQDTGSIFANPNLNSNGTLPSVSSARNLAPAQTFFSDDFNGTARGAAPWDAGAFEFAAGGPTPPSVTGAAINALGTQFALTFSRAVQFGTGGTGGLVISSTAGAVTLGTPSIAGSVITWPITNRLIGAGETLTRVYTQPTNGIEAVDNQADANSFPSSPVTNSSTVAQVAIPAFAPLPGAYSSTQNVVITSTPGATIRYTTDGTTPTSSTGTLYTAPISTSLNTTYTARAFLSGSLDSPIATGAYQIGDFVIVNSFTNVPVASQIGTFTWSFRATSSVVNNDAVMALSDHAATGYPDLAVIARFGPAGNIDAYNGTVSNYAAVNPFPYVAGQTYEFVVTVNVPAHTFSMTVKQVGAATATTIATNYAFRGTQASVADLDNFAALSSLGTVTISNMVFSAAATISMTGMSVDSTGTRLAAAFNSQPSFGLGGQGGFTVSASGGAVTAGSPQITTNTITWTLSRAISRGEALLATYVQPGNGIEATSGGADLASFAGQSVVNNSSVDLTAPVPNPSTFGIAPTATSSSTITMTATTSTDAFSGPVSYFFNETSGNAGGSDSGWQSSPTFTDTGLAAGTQYSYRVMTRDSAPTPNTTTFSATASATTRSVAGARPAMPFNVARANIVNP